MKKTLMGLVFIGSISANAAMTRLDMPAEPSASKIKQAIKKLSEAAQNKNKSANLNAARNLIKMTTRKTVFKSAVYINGNKQFNDRGDEVTSWNFSGYCYKGNVNSAVALINAALKLGYWESDGVWIDNASANNSMIELNFVDGPNELDWDVSFGACK